MLRKCETENRPKLPLSSFTIKGIDAKVGI